MNEMVRVENRARREHRLFHRDSKTPGATAECDTREIANPTTNVTGVKQHERQAVLPPVLRPRVYPVFNPAQAPREYGTGLRTPVRRMYNHASARLRIKFLPMVQPNGQEKLNVIA